MKRQSKPHGLLGAMATRTLSRLFASLIQLLTLTLIARDLGPATFAQFAILVTVSASVAGIATQGMPTHALRLQLTQDPKASALAVLLLCGSSYAVVALSLLVLGIETDMTTAVVLAACFSVFAEGGNDGVQFVLSGLERQRLAGTLMILRRLVVFVAVTAATIAGSGTMAGLLIGSAVVAAMPFLLVWELRNRRPPLRRTLKDARRYWLLNASSSAAFLDTSLATLSLGAHLGGSYAAGARLASPLSIVVQAFANIAAPALSRGDGDDRTGILRNMRLVTRGYAALVVVASPLIATAAVWLLGPEYDSSFGVVVGFCFASALSALSQSYVADHVSRGASATITAAMIAGITTTLAGVYVLGQIAGILGAAIAPVLGQLVAWTLLAYNDSRREEGESRRRFIDALRACLTS